MLSSPHGAYDLDGETDRQEVDKPLSNAIREMKETVAVRESERKMADEALAMKTRLAT